MSFHLSALLSSKRPPVNSSVQLVPCQWAEIASARGCASEERPRWRVKTRTTSGEHFLRSVVGEARMCLSKLNHVQTLCILIGFLGPLKVFPPAAGNCLMLRILCCSSVPSPILRVFSISRYSRQPQLHHPDERVIDNLSSYPPFSSADAIVLRTKCIYPPTTYPSVSTCSSALDTLAA